MPQLPGDTVRRKAAQHHQGEEQHQDRQVAQGVAAGHGGGQVGQAMLEDFEQLFENQGW